MRLGIEINKDIMNEIFVQTGKTAGYWKKYKQVLDLFKSYALSNKSNTSSPVDIYLLKVNIRNTITRRRSGVFIVNFEHISHLLLVLLLLTLSR